MPAPQAGSLVWATPRSPAASLLWMHSALRCHQTTATKLPPRLHLSVRCLTPTRSTKTCHRNLVLRTHRTSTSVALRITGAASQFVGVGVNSLHVRMTCGWEGLTSRSRRRMAGAGHFNRMWWTVCCVARFQQMNTDERRTEESNRRHLLEGLCRRWMCRPTAGCTCFNLFLVFWFILNN